LTGLVCFALQHAASVTQFAVSELSDRFLTTAARCLLLTSELHRLIRVFESAGIKAVPFKGPVLSSMIYGNPAMWTFDDLDILVQREDMACARELLRSNGYGLRSDGGHRQEPDRVARAARNAESAFVQCSADPRSMAQASLSVGARDTSPNPTGWQFG
jgi:hypothetical protein